MDPILSELNEPQQRAVLHPHGPLLVLAGAGSGKTRVITRRIARLLREGVDPYSILALTFTNKAAGEMRRRVEELGGATVHVSTFHSACARFLRRDVERLGYPQSFSIYDTYDRDQCLKGLMQELGVQTKCKPSDVGREISRLKNLLIRPQELPPARTDVAQVVAQVYEPYELRMQKLGAFDFDDLLLRFLDLLQADPEVRERYQRRFAWILIDEFQDTNRVQYELTRHLLGPQRNLTVVGDPDQSIYKFRGAELRNMLEFARDYPDVTVVKLEENYRSTGNILAAAEAVIAHNESRLEKRLFTQSEAGALVQRFERGTPQDEADEVGRRIEEALAEGVSPQEIAVFYRTHFLSRAVEETLRHRGIAYEVVGGWAFFERREIKDMLAYLRVAANPLDDVSLERIVNVPPRGLGPAAVQKLKATASALAMSLSEAVLEPTARGEFTAKARQGLEQLAQIVTEVRADGQRSAAAALATVLLRTDYIKHACSTGDPEDEARRENLDELLNDATTYDADGGEGLAGYLQHVSLLTSEDRQDAQGPRVSLMSVHAAKGLEFDHVFVIGLEDGLFPHSRSRDDRAELEEERRLMYVALTRARKTLCLSHAEERMVQGSFQTQEPSRFFDEIPAEAMAGEVRAARRDPFANYELDAAPELAEFAPGMRVWHEHYGRGSVHAVSGRGISRSVLVRFDRGGERTLLLEYAGLVAIPPEEES